MAVLDRIIELADAIGGPIGSALKAVAETAAGTVAAIFDPPEKDPTKTIAFTIGTIALSAKMAKADGVVTRDEVAAFARVFRFEEADRAHVIRVFDFAKQDVAGFDAYAKQIAKLLKDHSAVLEDVLDGLFFIAKADGEVTEPEIAYLEIVADIFGYTESEFARISASHLGGDDPYLVLGVEPDADDDDVRKAWVKLAKENHPDQLVARGVPKDFMEIAEAKLAAINNAYDQVKLMRGIA